MPGLERSLIEQKLPNCALQVGCCCRNLNFEEYRPFSNGSEVGSPSRDAAIGVLHTNLVQCSGKGAPYLSVAAESGLRSLGAHVVTAGEFGRASLGRFHGSFLFCHGGTKRMMQPHTTAVRYEQRNLVLQLSCAGVDVGHRMAINDGSVEEGDGLSLAR